MKRCLKCNEEKPAESFRSDGRATDGLLKICIACEGVKIDLPKTCPKCGICKSGSDFYSRKDRPGVFVRSWCRKCHVFSSTHAHKKRVTKNPAGMRAQAKNSKLNYDYGISLSDWNEMFKKQNGQCAICREYNINRGWGGLYVDHDHKTGKVRGLLCKTCNWALGMLKDSSKLARAAADYLDASS